MYQTAVGSLLYLSTRTCPDIAYAGSVSYGLLYTGSDLKDCEGYSDLGWERDVNDYKSTSGGAAVSWKNKKQTSTSLSTAEAEYTALCSAAQKACWMKQLLSDLRYGSSLPMVIYEDNQSAICMTKNQLFYGRTKHILIKYHFISELVADGIIKVVHCPTQVIMADVLTKGLNQVKFDKLREMIGVKQTDRNLLTID
uniref:Reverse transcriptase Ty1/copia-type domain-containing protein n=1 Tax=Amphimedon queenslandica TaxID=400682 RepID=A0A1X7STA9_AMPQE